MILSLPELLKNGWMDARALPGRETCGERNEGLARRHVCFRAMRTLSRHHQMTESDPKRTYAGSKSHSAARSDRLAQQPRTACLVSTSAASFLCHPKGGFDLKPLLLTRNKHDTVVLGGDGNNGDLADII